MPINSNIKVILDKLFELYGFLPNLERFLLFYPCYLEKIISVEESLFEGGKIESKIAYFLAFIASAELGCGYLMARYNNLFKRRGGDTSWISEGSYPVKYR